METSIEAIQNCYTPNELERVKIIDPPYTVFGSSVLMPSFTISMTVKGLKKMLSLANEDDTFQVTIHHEKMTEYSIIRKKTAPQDSVTVQNSQTTAQACQPEEPASTH